MPLTLTLRRSADWSPFRQQLLKLVNAPGGQHVFLCSGFIDVAVFDDELIAALHAGCENGKLVLLAGILNVTEFKDWPALYDATIDKLQAAGISVSAYEVPMKNWHAKIALRMDQATPIAAIVGSSNLTNPAVTIKPWKWNYECDITMWHEPTLTDYFRKEQASRDPFESAELILDPVVADQPDIGARLEQLYADLTTLRKQGKLVKRKRDNS
jgi:hypothetical protein